MVKGGFEVRPVRPSDFKYTISDQRMQWNFRTFPIGPHLLQVVQSIPWRTYRFDGPVRLTVGNIVETFHCVASTEKYPHYYYFGGSVYEILQTVYPTEKGFPRIRDYIDPTGDIDVLLLTPTIHVDSKNDISNDMVLTDSDGRLAMNEFVDHYTRWVFEQFMTQLDTISNRLWNHLFQDSEPFDYHANAEGNHADIVFQKGNVWLTRIPLLNSNMVKIQLIVKYKGLDADHILEIVMPLTRGHDVLKDHTHQHASEMDILPGEFPISSFVELLDGNVGACRERIELWNTPICHKFYNHVGRLQYLNKLLPLILQNPFDATTPNLFQYPTPKYYSFAAAVLGLMYFLLESKLKGNICKFDFRYVEGDCSAQTILDGIGKSLVLYIFRDTRHSLLNRKNTVLGVRYTRILGTRYDTYEVVEHLFPTISLKGGRYTYRRKRTYRRRKTASNSAN